MTSSPRHRLRPHEGLGAAATLPPLEPVLALVERQESAGGHWYWNGDFSADREPMFAWQPPGQRRVRYAVPRLLHQLMGTFPARSGVLNTCGLVSCANPSHWCVETPQQRGAALKPVVVVDFHGHGWTTVSRTGPCDVCFQPASTPCDPVYHDAEFRRRMAREATPCPICLVKPHEACLEEVHRAVFVHSLTRSGGTS